MDRRDRSYLGLVNYLPIAQSPISGTADDISAPVVSINNLPPYSQQPGICWRLLTAFLRQ